MTGARARTPLRAAPKLAGALLAALFLLLAAEGAAGVLLAWKDAGDEPTIREQLHCRYDPDLGWSHRPSERVANLYGPGRSLTTNARAFRALEEYTEAVPAGRYRIVCVGDSFTLGYGVDDRATYEAELEAQEPRIQAVNMGQGAYGVDQAYLWYKRDGLRLAADLVLFAFIAPDFERMLETRFDGRYSKPLLRAVEGALVLENVPVPDDFERASGDRRRAFVGRLALSELVQRLKRRDRAAEALALAGSPLPFREPAELLLADLARLCRERGAELVLLQIPLRDPLAGRPREVSAWVRGVAEALGVPFLDLSASFEALPPAEAELYYQPDGHFNALGNRFVAQRLLELLPALVPSFPR